MLRIEHLNAGYAELQVLKDICLELQPETISVLMGPNGAGKSTLLKSVFNLTNIDSGKIIFNSRDISGQPAHSLLNMGIAYVGQNKINFSTLTVRDNLILGAPAGSSKKYRADKITEVYKHFPVLQEKDKALAFSLSGGQQQLLAMGRALISSPKLLLLDEPTLGLSPKLVKETFERILYIKDNFKTTVLVVEHNLKSLMDIADYGYVLLEGKIAAHGTCLALKRDKIMDSVFTGTFE